ncbi:hypothetical protein MycrhDRAFT_3660 [Mycolicibacterium rhodesiae JS60]|nr:hypothetical protein MycrhDRAFT_3660 [Mycolicibacterium rhodesiae JS60]
MVETCVGLFPDRHVPVGMLAEQCKVLEASPGVDGVLLPDQLASFVPQQLWRPENTAMAQFMRDPDSLHDAFTLGAYVAAIAPSLKLHLTTDAVRRPPAELVQSLLTLAAITEGRLNVQIGGGEIKQTRPFGHPTNQAMSRMSDLFQIYRKFMDSDGPFDFEGKRWKFNGAYLGGAKQYQPEVWGLGAGPMLLDHVTSWADGLATSVPSAFASPDRVGTAIEGLRRQLEQKGRDPKQFRVGLWFSVLLHEDDAELERAFANPLLKFVSGAMGRIETQLWNDEGLGLPFPPGWTYFKDLLPYGMDDAFVDEIVSAVTPEHMQRAWLVGSPAEVARQVQPYLDAGVDWVMAIDYLPVVGTPEDAAAAATRGADLCAHIKQLDLVDAP